MARLHLVTPEGPQLVELRAHNSLGRHPNNSIQLLDKIVSKEHCTVEQRGPEIFVLKDLGSLNGTYINGERLNGEQQLRHGDEIALGSTRARFDDGSSPVAPPAVAPAPGSPWSVMGSTHPSGGATPSAQASTVGAPLHGYAAPGGAPVPGGAPAPGAGLLPQGSGTQAIPAMPDQRAPATPGVDVSDQSRAIGTQMAATQKGFLPYDQIAGNTVQLAGDYERLRLSNELSREIALERDLPSLLTKILLAMFRFVRADRGVIFLRSPSGELTPGASLRRDGTTAPISVSSTIMNHVIQERATVLTHDAAMDFAASKGKSMILNRISSAIVAPLVHNHEILGVMWLDSESLAQFQQKDMEIVTSIAAQAAMFIEINILGKKIEQEVVNRERFSRLLSPNVASRVMSGELEVKKGGQLVPEASVFNSDIRGFTRMSEGARPEAIVDMLNEYFELMVECLFKYEGTLDKFMGDGIMALWGAPVMHPDDATRSVLCALEQMELVGHFNRRRVADTNLPPLAVGMGIHTGPLVAGYLGSSKALSYTVIGDTANTSARLCGVALAGQILIGEATLARLGSKFETEELAPAHLKGKEKPFRVFNVLRRAPSAQVPASMIRPAR